MKEAIGSMKFVAIVGRSGAGMDEYRANTCHFCGTYTYDGYEIDGTTRHFLSDCRPDLVEHEPGELCTWPNRITGYKCYAYQNRETLEWTNEHIHFYKDGPL